MPVKLIQLNRISLKMLQGQRAAGAGRREGGGAARWGPEAGLAWSKAPIWKVNRLLSMMRGLVSPGT